MRTVYEIQRCRIRVYIEQTLTMERWWRIREGMPHLQHIIHELAYVTSHAELEHGSVWYLELHDPDAPPLQQYAKYGNDPSAMEEPIAILMRGKQMYVDNSMAGRFFLDLAAAPMN